MDSLGTSLATCPTAQQWARVGTHPHHGIQIALSALHTENSSGIGEFLDLIPLIDWCHQLRFDFLQLLPLNNSESDSSPYNSESSCALNFLYLSLWALPELEKYPQLQKELSTFKQLNTTERVLYSNVSEKKISFLKQYHAQAGAELLKTKEVLEFINQNNWIKPYALFKTLKMQFDHAPWREWPPQFQCLKESQREALYPLYEQEMSFYILIQYLCFKQMTEVKLHATNKPFFLMGDLPILLSQESVDNWQYVEFFDPYLGAGAPPDQYNKEGQNWKLPIFNWDALRKDQFSWWKQRLKTAQQFFDLFRIDHVLGFFRIFAIPFYKENKEGSFIPNHDQEAKAQGKELLSKLSSLTQMLPIGEDLGTVPPYVRPCLKDLGICGTKVMRWERRWEGDKGYIPVEQYEPLSLTCVSTHDSETLTLWWKNCEIDARLFCLSKGWTYTKELTFTQREEILKESHSSSSLFHANLLQEYLGGFPELIHSCPEEERINIPGLVLENNWTYRYKLPLEKMLCHEGLKALMQRILKLQ